MNISDEAILIPEESEFKFFEYNSSIYCVDIHKPHVLRITEDVKQILDKHKGKSIDFLKNNEIFSSVAIDQLVGLRTNGFFSPKCIDSTDDIKYFSKIAIEVTNVCNLSCVYCYSGTKNSKVFDSYLSKINSIKFLEFIENFSNENSIELNFFGGEPLLNFKQIEFIVNHCKTLQKQYRFGITTNCTLLTREIARFLKEHKFTIVVSLDGNSEIHDKTRPYINGKGSHEHVLRGINNIKEFYGNDFVVNCILTKKSPLPYDKLLFFKSIGLDKISLTPVSASNDKTIDLDDESIEMQINSDEKIFKEILDGDALDINYLPFTHYMKMLVKPTKKRFRCGVGREMIAISTMGKIYPCHRFLGNDAFLMGDITHGISNGNHKLYSNIDFTHFSDCSTCWARTLCGGPCLYNSFTYTGSVDHVSTERCQRIKKLIELSIILYGELIAKDKERLIRYLTT